MNNMNGAKDSLLQGRKEDKSYRSRSPQVYRGKISRDRLKDFLSIGTETREAREKCHAALRRK